MIFRIARIVAIAAALFFTLHASAQQQTFTVCPALGGSDWAVNLAYDGSHIWVSCYQGNKVVEINASNGAIVRQVTVSSPVGILYEGGYIWVSTGSNNKVVKIVASTGAVAGTFTVQGTPYGMTFDGHYVWVANLSGNSVSKVLATTGAVTTYSVPCTAPISMAFDTVHVWVSCRNSGQVLELSSTGSVLTTFGVPNAEGLAFRGPTNGAYLYAGSMDMPSTGGGEVFAIYAQDPLNWFDFYVGENPTDVALDGTYLWVLNYGFQKVSKLNADTGAVLATYSVTNPVGGWGGGGILFDGSNIWVTATPNGATGGVTKIPD